MSKKRLVDWVQNLILTLLTVSALFLLTRLFLFHGNLPAQFQAALSPQPAPPEAVDLSSGLREMFPSVHIMVTSDSAYGRYGQLYVPEDDPLLQQIIPLFREALGSAGQMTGMTDSALRTALASPGIYLDLIGILPLEAVATWLGEESIFSWDLRAMALSASGEETAGLYLLDKAGSVFLCRTALPVSAVQALCERVSPNNSSFAYEEADYQTLDPYSILVAQAPELAAVEAAIPDGYSAYNLLTSLDFNAHTNSRYTETSSGVEVVEESPRTLRIGPDGTVGYFMSGDGPTLLAGQTGDALEAACRLANALTSGTGATPLYLRAVQEEEAGWKISFHYQIDGIPVFFTDEEDALTVTVSAGTVTSFRYRCRSYTLLEESGEAAALPLYPPAMAAAIAAHYPSGKLSIGYVDNGLGRITAQWLAN